MNNEIIVDNFAGGGGASTGIEMAIGRSVDIAVNHDPNAIAMHTTNHPGTLHYCESVFTVKPKIVTAGRPVALAWYSPDCRHFSKAKGAKPVEKSIRGLAWIELRWGLEVKPRVMMLENVGEFRTWGPLLVGEMRPDPERAGETFKAFVGMLTTGIPANHPALAECCEFLEIDIHSEQAMRLINGLGYTVEYRELRACDYGAPTIRKRFFMVARCDGQPVVWPEPTHGDPKSEAVKSGRLKPWRTAAECLDWSIPAPSIFGRKKPLAENTLRRIARGIQRFVIDSEQPYIVPFIEKCNHTSIEAALTPFLAGNGGSEYQAKPRPLDKPAQTRNKPLSPITVSRYFMRARKASGIVFTGEPPTFHEIRSLAARLYARQVSDSFAQHLLGHKSDSMAARYRDSRGKEWDLIDVEYRTNFE
ncbi:tyrosine-type recombinase/integrase [Salmonella enterica]